MKYLVACDLDNTLLTDKKKISKKSIKFIRKYVEKGNCFAICTGRPISSAISFYESLGINVPIISDNGALITYPYENRKVEFAIKLETFLEFLEKTNDFLVSGLVNSKEKLFIQNRPDIPKWLMHFLPETLIIEGNLLENVDINPLLPNLWVKEEKFNDFIQILDTYKNEIAYRYWGFFAGRHSFELFSVNASKGLAMNYLKEEFKCDKTIAFGDQLNDLPMIELADYGVAMVNSIDELKKISKYITKKDYNHNGVIHFLKKNKLM